MRTRASAWLWCPILHVIYCLMAVLGFSLGLLAEANGICLVLGNEASGPSEHLKKKCCPYVHSWVPIKCMLVHLEHWRREEVCVWSCGLDCRVSVPMSPFVESLNVGSATSIVVSELKLVLDNYVWVGT